MAKLFVLQKETCVFRFKAKRTNLSHLLLIVFFFSLAVALGSTHIYSWSNHAAQHTTSIFTYIKLLLPFNKHTEIEFLVHSYELRVHVYI